MPIQYSIKFKPEFEPAFTTPEAIQVAVNKMYGDCCTVEGHEKRKNDCVLVVKTVTEEEDCDYFKLEWDEAMTYIDIHQLTYPQDDCGKFITKLWPPDIPNLINALRMIAGIE